MASKERIPVAETRDQVMASTLVPTGTYTLVGTDGHDATINLCPAGEWATHVPPGTLEARLLTGPQNTRDFTGFAFVYPDGQIRPWKRAGVQPLRALYALFEADDPAALGYAYALKSSRCFRCGRPLTVSSSLIAGLGPDCAEIVGEWFAAKYGGTLPAAVQETIERTRIDRDLERIVTRVRAVDPEPYRPALVISLAQDEGRVGERMRTAFPDRTVLDVTRDGDDPADVAAAIVVVGYAQCDLTTMPWLDTMAWATVEHYQTGEE